MNGMLNNLSQEFGNRITALTKLVEDLANSSMRFHGGSTTSNLGGDASSNPISAYNALLVSSGTSFRHIGSEPTHQWGGRIWNPVPAPGIPWPENLHPQNLWHLWYEGKPISNHHPYRHLRQCHLASPKHDRLKLCRAGQFIKVLERICIDELHLVENENALYFASEHQLKNCFEKSFAVLLTKIGNEVDQDPCKKRKMMERSVISLSYMTLWNDLHRYKLLTSHDNNQQ